MPHLPNSTIFVVGNRIMTSGDFVFEAEQGSLDSLIEDFGPPIINFISPTVMMEGERIEITMSGNRTYNPLALSISGAGVAVEDVYVNSDGQITARVEAAPDSAVLVNAGDNDLRSITVTTLDGQQDSDGNSIAQSSTFAGKLRVYFSAPSLVSVSFQDAGSSPIVNQGDTVTATFTGTKFYDKWDGNQDMTSRLADLSAQGLQLQSMTVNSPTSATATFTVDADATRQSHDIKVNTYSGDSNTAVGALTVYYSAPTIATLTEQSGADMTTIAANETKSLRMSGTRMEGVDAPARIEVGQIDAQGNFSLTAPKEDGTGTVTLSDFCTISNVSLSAVAGTGAGHSVDFDLAIDQTMANDLSNIGFRITALDAAGSLQAVLPFGETFSIDAAEPALTSIAVATRPAGDAQSMYDGLGQQTVTITGQNLYGDLRSISMAGSPAGITLANAQKNSNTEVQVDITVDGTAAIGLYAIEVEMEGGTASSAAVAAAKLDVIHAAPTLSADPAHNHLTLDRPNSGTHQHTFNITGTNFMNIFDAGNTSDGLRATDGDFVDYFQSEDTMTIELIKNGAPASGLTNPSLSAVSTTSAAGEVTVASNAPLGLVDLRVTTRSGQTALLAGVFDVIPGDPEFTSIVPDLIMETDSAVMVLSGANFHPAGDGAPAGSTLLPISHPLAPVGAYTDVAYGDSYVADDNSSDWYVRNPAIFSNAVGGETVELSISGSSEWEFTVFDSAGIVDLGTLGDALFAIEQDPNASWVNTASALPGDGSKWIAIRVKPAAALGAHDATLISATATSDPQSIALSVNVISEAQQLNNEADALIAQADYGIANHTPGDASSLGYLNNVLKPQLIQKSSDLDTYQQANSPFAEEADMLAKKATLDQRVIDIEALV